MPLRLLLDEQISPIVADQVRRHRPELIIESVHTWQAGGFRGRHDRELILAASAEGWTLATYDQKTIPNVLVELAVRGHHHAGVIFIDDRTIPSHNFGLLVRAIIAFMDRNQALEWQDRAHFLDRP